MRKLQKKIVLILRNANKLDHFGLVKILTFVKKNNLFILLTYNTRLNSKKIKSFKITNSFLLLISNISHICLNSDFEIQSLYKSIKFALGFEDFAIITIF